jgi:hypothetical protein
VKRVFRIETKERVYNLWFSLKKQQIKPVPVLRIKVYRLFPFYLLVRPSWLF